MAIGNYRKTMNTDVLHAWAADAQAELEQLRAQLHSLQGVGEAVAWRTGSIVWAYEEHAVKYAERFKHKVIEPLYTRPADPDAVPVRRELLEQVRELLFWVSCDRPDNWASWRASEELRQLLANNEGIKP